jgi:hypothetical protein
MVYVLSVFDGYILTYGRRTRPEGVRVQRVQKVQRVQRGRRAASPPV